MKKGTGIRKQGRQVSLTFKISLMIISIIVSTLILNAFLNYFNFAKTFGEIHRARFLVTAQDLKQAIESELNLGLELTELKSPREKLLVLIQQDGDISVIRIFDHNGNLLFSTEETGSLKSIPEEWNKKIKVTGNEVENVVWNFSNDEENVIGLPLVNSFNVKAGLVALSYSGRHEKNKNTEMLAYLKQLSIYFALGFGLLAVLGVKWMNRPLKRHFQELEKSAQQLLENPYQGQKISGSQAEIIQDYDDFRHKTTEVMQQLKDLKSKI